MSVEKVLDALKRHTCRKIIDVLRDGPKSVTEITAMLGFGGRTNTSQALAVLLRADIVFRRTEGQRHYYQLRAPALQEASDYVYGLLRDVRRFPVSHSAATNLR